MQTMMRYLAMGAAIAVMGFAAAAPRGRISTRSLGTERAPCTRARMTPPAVMETSPRCTTTSRLVQPQLSRALIG